MRMTRRLRSHSSPLSYVEVAGVVLQEVSLSEAAIYILLRVTGWVAKASAVVAPTDVTHAYLR